MKLRKTLEFALFGLINRTSVCRLAVFSQHVVSTRLGMHFLISAKAAESVTQHLLHNRSMTYDILNYEWVKLSEDVMKYVK